MSSLFCILLALCSPDSRPPEPVGCIISCCSSFLRGEKKGYLRCTCEKRPTVNAGTHRVLWSPGAASQAEDPRVPLVYCPYGSASL